jgi:protein O-GlcNAc transferase
VTIEQAISLGVQHHQAGRLSQAEEQYRRVLVLQPNHGDALHLLGLLAYQSGNNQAACDLIQRAIDSKSGVAEYHNSLGKVHDALGNPSEAIVEFERATELNPHYALAYANLGNLLREQGGSDKAVAAYRRAIEIRPTWAEVFVNLADVLRISGRFEEAVATCRRALEINPSLAEAYRNLGRMLIDRGRVEDALDAFLKLRGLGSATYDDLNSLAFAFRARGSLDESITVLRQITQLYPQRADALVNLGSLLFERGEIDAAIAVSRQAIQLKPDSPEAHNNLGTALRYREELAQAEAHYRKAIQLKPDYAAAFNNLGSTLKDQGRVNEAVQSYMHAVSLSPASAEIESNAVYTAHCSPDYEEQHLLELALAWGLRHGRALSREISPHENDRSIDRVLKIGYVSPDFRQHAVGRFIQPILKDHNRSQFEVHCFSTVARPDSRTAEIQRVSDHWHDVSRHSDEQLSQLIRREKIDILVDLALHTSNNRLLVFARKPAPVQLSYLAYCGTSGLELMDYVLTDSFLMPPDANIRAYSEQPVWLSKSYWCYPKPEYDYKIGPLPANSTGQVTFGCFNSFCKISKLTEDAWCKLLRGLPKSRLVVHAPHGPHRQIMRDRFAINGIEEDRIQFVGFLPLPQYYQRYAEIDIALDPFPYCGGTTTCDALWMGVPVVTFCGQTAVGRAGCSILSNAGFPQLVAKSASGYVKIATELATDLPRLSAIRQSLRARMEASSLMDQAGFMCDLESAYRKMWRSWCTGVNQFGNN